jgi:hypothetical protein
VENEHVLNAWRKAADDLSITVATNVLVDLPDGGNRRFLALVSGFGTIKGTLIGLLSEGNGGAFFANCRLAEQLGFCYSELNPEAYSEYDREQFIETLVDWGWADPGQEPPEWYQEALGRYRSTKARP